MTDALGDFLGRLASTTLEGPEQVLGLMGDGLQLFGAQLERMAELIDQLQDKLNADPQA